MRDIGRSDEAISYQTAPECVPTLVPGHMPVYDPTYDPVSYPITRHPAGNPISNATDPDLDFTRGLSSVPCPSPS